MQNINQFLFSFFSFQLHFGSDHKLRTHNNAAEYGQYTITTKHIDEVSFKL
jgi:hypothetical protein